MLCPAMILLPLGLSGFRWLLPLSSFHVAQRRPLSSTIAAPWGIGSRVLSLKTSDMFPLLFGCSIARLCHTELKKIRQTVQCLHRQSAFARHESAYLAFG